MTGPASHAGGRAGTGRVPKTAVCAIAAVSLLAAGCTRPLPDPGSPGAVAYAAQCGICHVPYQPGSMTFAMWEIQVARMDELRARRGVPPLADADRRAILDYLKAHSG